MTTGNIMRASTTGPGEESNGASYTPQISADGRYVAFESDADNLVPGDDNGVADTFVKDLQTGAIVVANAPLEEWAIYNRMASADGRYVASIRYHGCKYTGNSPNDLLVEDIETGEIIHASTSDLGTSEECANSRSPNLSPDGRYIAFWSNDGTLVPDDTNHYWKDYDPHPIRSLTAGDDIFVKDLKTGEIVRASTAADGSEVDGKIGGGSVSGDGRYVVFDSEADNLVPGDTNGLADIFAKDLKTGAIMRVSNAPDGTQANGASGNARISADGRTVAFVSEADNLVPDDTNHVQDVFVRDLWDLWGVSLEGTPEGDSLSGGDGYDVINGLGGDDTIDGRGGNDWLQGDAGNDRLIGGAGRDVLDGGDGDDDLESGMGNDVLNGGDGDDVLNGGDGDDVLNGGDGDDWLVSSAGNDSYEGGDGDDTLTFEDVTGGMAVDLSAGTVTGPDTVVGTVGGIENVIGGAGNDTVQGGARDEVLDGGAGEDSLMGGVGNDVIKGASGDDHLLGGAGDDTLSGGGGNDTGEGGSGHDNLLGQAGEDSLFGGGGHDICAGGDGDDSLIGGAGDDTLDGGAGDDVLHGGLGDEDASLGTGELILWNKLGSNEEVRNSEIGVNGEIPVYYDYYSYLDFASVRHGNGFAPRAVIEQDYSYVNFQKPFSADFPDAGALEFWWKTGRDENASPYYDTQPPLDVLELPWMRITYGAGDYRTTVAFSSTGGDDDPSEYTATYDLDFKKGDIIHVALSWDQGWGAEPLRLYVDGDRMDPEEIISVEPEHLIEKVQETTSDPDFTYALSLQQPKHYNYKHLGSGSPPESYISIDSFSYLDNLKIWNYAKTDFSDRFVEDSGVDGAGVPAPDCVRVRFVGEGAANQSTYGWYDTETLEAGILVANTDTAANPGVENFVAALPYTPDEVDTLGFFLIPNGYRRNDDPGEPFANGDGTDLDLEVFKDGGVWKIRDTGSGHVFEGTGNAAYFTEAAKNPGGLDHVMEAGDLLADGAVTHKWEDQRELGDQDFDDVILQVETAYKLQVSFVSESAANQSTYGYYNINTGQARILAANVDTATNPGIADLSATLCLSTDEIDHLGFFLIPNGYRRNGDAGEPFADGDGTDLDLEVFEDGGVWKIRDTDSGYVFEGMGNPAYFTEAAKNPGGLDHVTDTGGLMTDGVVTQAWEDQRGLGDQDFNDVVFKASLASGPASGGGSGIPADDVLTGGGGNDTLSGGPGADTFRYKGTGFGRDEITDFALGIDTIAFEDVGSASQADELTYTVGNVGGDETVHDIRITFAGLGADLAEAWIDVLDVGSDVDALKADLVFV